MSEHGEPWRISTENQKEWEFRNKYGRYLGKCSGVDTTLEEDEAYAARLVACVNFCAAHSIEDMTSGTYKAALMEVAPRIRPTFHAEEES